MTSSRPYDEKSLLQSISVMYNNPMMADIYFLVGEKQLRVPAHKFVLSIRNSVFYAMFQGDLSDSTEKEIKLPDVPAPAFLNLLQHLYKDQAFLNGENVLSTLYTARKYLEQSLEKDCLTFLKSNLRFENVCTILSSSTMIEDAVLIKKAWDMVDEASEDVLKSEGFSDINHATLLDILKRENLSCSELVVFTAACSWAEAECWRREEEHTPERIRDVLGDALKSIRFPVMKASDFANKVAKSGILNPMDVIDIFCCITSDQKPVLQYSDSPRRGGLKICSRFKAVSRNGWNYGGEPDAIQFSVQRPVSIVGVRVFGCRHGPSEYDVQLDLKEDNQVIATKSLKLKTDGSPETFPVFFDKSVQIQGSKWYTIKVLMKGSFGFCGQEGLEEVEAGNSNTKFQFRKSGESENATDVNKGQIPDIVFI